jgi:ABC-2 type transport system permease protein
VSALVRAELLKLRTTRTLAWLLLATLAMVVVTVAASVPSANEPDAGLSLHEPALLPRLVGISLSVPEVIMALLGVLAFTQEIRYGTVSSTFLVEPRRHRVLAAKGVALLLAAVVITTATLLVSFTVSVVLIRAKDGDVTAGLEFGQVVAAVFAVMMLYGLIGLAIGALMRNQLVAVTATLVWLTVAEHLLLDALPQAARWTPVGATYGLLRLGPIVTTGGTLLDAPIGGLLLVGYATAALALALIVEPRRDVLR